MSALALETGDIVADKFRIEGPLGRGGMGAVFKATHLALDEPVALKFMLDPGAHREERVARFLREAKTAMRLKSEHIARVFDAGQLADKTPYMVLEYLQGQDLSELLRAQGRLPIETAANYVLQACSGIAEAHAAGIVHRDLKPSNLFVVDHLGGAKLIKVLDFGISKLADDAALSTATDQMMGSPLYMSPEQMRSARYVDQRTDIWALGAILYECIAGRPPFRAGPLPELILRVLQEPPESMGEELEVPQSLRALISECLAKDEGDRPATVAEVACTLAPFCASGAESLVARIQALQLDAAARSGGDEGADHRLAAATVTAQAAAPFGPAAIEGVSSTSPWPSYALAVGLAIALGLLFLAVSMRESGHGARVATPQDAAITVTLSPPPPGNAMLSFDAGLQSDAGLADAGASSANALPMKRDERRRRRPESKKPDPEPPQAPDAGRSSPRDRRN